MQPDQQPEVQAPIEPSAQPVQPVQYPTPQPDYASAAAHPQHHKMATRTKVALWLMIGPTALFIVSLIIYAILNAIPAQTPSPETTTNLFAEASPLQTAGSIILFISGAVTILTWLPGMIIGIVLLATKKKPAVQ